jgi:membrane-associated protease RseP (regulator of RpoE activity)
MNPKIKANLIHLSLFLVTFVTTTLAGTQWASGKTIDMEGFSWTDFTTGLPYSITFLFVLTVHEFGHYFTAVYYRVRTSLPYFIPLPPFYFLFGTLGAVIRIRDRISSKQQHFDIGIAGPLAGFVVAFGLLWYAFATLPPLDYLYQFHPQYEQFGADYAKYVYQPDFMKGSYDIVIGKNLLFMFFEKFVADPARVPNAHELIHYPVLFAGFLSLLFTSLNLLPIGQLDGGHVLYGLAGYQGHKKIATGIFVTILFFSGLKFVTLDSIEDWYWKIPVALGFLYLCLTGLKFSVWKTLAIAGAIFVVQFLTSIALPSLEGYPAFVVFLLMLGRFIGVYHPPALIEEELGTGRKLLGWLALLIFIICFSPSPINVVDPTVAP